MSNQLRILKEQLAKLESTSTEKIKEIQEKIEKIKLQEKEYQKKYYAEKLKQKRKEKRKEKKEEKLKIPTAQCVICGKMFVPYHKNTKCCSEECREVYTEQYQQEYKKGEKFKARAKAYRQSSAYKRARAKYSKSKKGKEALKRYFQKYKENGYKRLTTNVEPEIKS